MRNEIRSEEESKQNKRSIQPRTATTLKHLAWLLVANI